MGYVTDETVSFRTDLSVIPFAKPLSIGRRPGIKKLSSPMDLGMRVATEPLRLASLVLLDRRIEPIEPRVDTVDLLEALGELAEQTSSLAQLPHPLLALTDVVAATGGVKRFVYSDADDLMGLVTVLLEAPPVRHPVITEVAMESHAPTQVGNFGRRPFIDALLIDERLVILTEGKLHVLDGIGPNLWMEANDTSLVEITERLLESLGVPPPGVNLVETVAAAVDALLEANLLVRKDE
ncbi:hypothetical protein C7K25_07835 [Gulosibacter molinativorax]|uniref:PqqD family protein n=2 Tax=Gulosibacter molinativorax TaxID=256821 RepID=A0ABT7C822_9MICO|nr:hypothetical protein [Gulosibacter molinativorax]